MDSERRVFVYSLRASLKPFGFATSTLRWPWTTTAFRRLEPIPAPTPHRASAGLRSFMIAAKRTSFSPAGPTQETRAFSPCFSRKASSVSPTACPQREVASWSSGAPPRMERYAGWSVLPRKMILSFSPRFLSFPLKQLPQEPGEGGVRHDDMPAAPTDEGADERSGHVDQGVLLAERVAPAVLLEEGARGDALPAEVLPQPGLRDGVLSDA